MKLRLLIFFLICSSHVEAGVIKSKMNGFESFVQGELEWLNLSYTKNQNWSEIEQRINSGDLSMLNLRYADFDEVLSLFQTSFIAFNTPSNIHEWESHFQVSNVADNHLNLFARDVDEFIEKTGADFQSFSGQTAGYPVDFRSFSAVYGEKIEVSDIMFGTNMLRYSVNIQDVLNFQPDPLASTAWDNASIGKQPTVRNYDTHHNAHFLVRKATVVSEPGALTLLFTAMIAVFSRRKILKSLHK